MTRKAFIILSSFIVLMATTVSAQDFSFGISEVTVDPVQWAGSLEKKSDTEYILNYEATIEEGWYIYAQKSPAGIPFNFEFLQKDAGVSREKFAQESETKTAFDEIFEEDVIKYVGQNPVLSMPITLTDKSITIVKSVINYQVCKEVCIPQDFYIAHNLKTGKAKVFTDYYEFEKYGATPAQKDKGDSDDDYEEDESTSNKGLWTVFFLSFLGGLAALFTPCVFPMIPMTVSYFTKQSKSRAAGIRNVRCLRVLLLI